MGIAIIDMDRIRQALPERAKVVLGKTKQGITYLECIVRFPSLYEKGTKEEEETVEQVIEWQREILGRENIMEFYTKSTGSHWFVYMKRQPYEFRNATDDDINGWTGLVYDIVKDGKPIQDIP